MNPQRIWSRFTGSHKGQALVEYCFLVLTVAIIIMAVLAGLYMKELQFERIFKALDASAPTATMDTPALSSPQEASGAGGSSESKGIDWGITILLSIAANFITPLIQRCASSLFTALANQRIVRLHEKLKEVNVMVRNKDQLYLKTCKVGLGDFVCLSMGIFFSRYTSSLCIIFGMVLIALSVHNVGKHIALIDHVMRHDKYKVTVDAEIARLQKTLTKRSRGNM